MNIAYTYFTNIGFLSCNGRCSVNILLFSSTKIFSGPHPAGNIGTQIAAVAPVNKGETVWAVDGETVVRIGHLFAEGFVDYSCIVAVTGENVVNPCFIKTTAGIALSKLLHDNIKAQNSRIISGNVLTGTQESIDGYLRFPFRQTTVIPEINNDCEFMGWASLSPKKYSAAHTFFSWLAPKSKKYRFDAKINGSERAIIMAGEYDDLYALIGSNLYTIQSDPAGNVTSEQRQFVNGLNNTSITIDASTEIPLNKSLSTRSSPSYKFLQIGWDETQGSEPWCMAYVTASIMRYKTNSSVDTISARSVMEWAYPDLSYRYRSAGSLSRKWFR